MVIFNLILLATRGKYWPIAISLTSPIVGEAMSTTATNLVSIQSPKCPRYRPKGVTSAVCREWETFRFINVHYIRTTGGQAAIMEHLRDKLALLFML